MLKPYSILKDVESSATEVKEVEVNVDTTFVNKNISEIKDDEGKHIGWKIGVQEWWKNEEYIEKISKENKQLKLELNTSNMEILNTINTVNQETKMTQAQLMMEIARTLEELKGGD